MSHPTRPLADRPSSVIRYRPYPDPHKRGPRHPRDRLMITVDRRFIPQPVVEEATTVTPAIQHADERPEEEDVPVFGTEDHVAAVQPARGRLAAFLAGIMGMLRFNFFT